MVKFQVLPGSALYAFTVISAPNFDSNFEWNCIAAPIGFFRVIDGDQHFQSFPGNLRCDFSVAFDTSVISDVLQTALDIQRRAVCRACNSVSRGFIYFKFQQPGKPARNGSQFFNTVGVHVFNYRKTRQKRSWKSSFPWRRANECASWKI